MPTLPPADENHPMAVTTFTPSQIRDGFLVNRYAPRQSHTGLWTWSRVGDAEHHPTIDDVFAAHSGRMPVDKHAWGRWGRPLNNDELEELFTHVRPDDGPSQDWRPEGAMPEDFFAASRYERRNCPPGGISHGERQYRAGQFIPGTVLFQHAPKPVEYAPAPAPQDTRVRTYHVLGNNRGVVVRHFGPKPGYGNMFFWGETQPTEVYPHTQAVWAAYPDAVSHEKWGRAFGPLTDDEIQQELDRTTAPEPDHRPAEMMPEDFYTMSRYGEPGTVLFQHTPAQPPVEYDTESEHAAFQQAIRDNPHDDTNWLVYADWLDERGQPVQAARARWWAGAKAAIRDGVHPDGPYHEDWMVNQLANLPTEVRQLVGPELSRHVHDAFPVGHSQEGEIDTARHFAQMHGLGLVGLGQWIAVGGQTRERMERNAALTGGDLREAMSWLASSADRTPPGMLAHTILAAAHARGSPHSFSPQSNAAWQQARRQAGSVATSGLEAFHGYASQNPFPPAPPDDGSGVPDDVLRTLATDPNQPDDQDQYPLDGQYDHGDELAVRYARPDQTIQQLFVAMQHVAGKLGDVAAARRQDQPAQPDDPTQNARVEYAEGNQDDVLPMLRSISPQAWRGDQQADMTPRLVAADLFDELGRSREAAMLRDTGRHLYVDFGGVVEDAHELSRQIHGQGPDSLGRDRHLDQFTRNYVEAAIDHGVYQTPAEWFTERGGPDVNDIHPATLAAMVADSHHIRALYGPGGNWHRADGHDFYGSRNGDQYTGGWADTHKFSRADIPGMWDLHNAAYHHDPYELHYDPDTNHLHGSYEVSPDVPPIERTQQQAEQPPTPPVDDGAQYPDEQNAAYGPRRPPARKRVTPSSPRPSSEIRRPDPETGRPLYAAAPPTEYVDPADTPLYRKLMALRPHLAHAAQQVYDQWDASDEEFGDPEVGFGGICQDISCAVSDVLAQHGIGTRELDAQTGEQHVWTFAHDGENGYHVDIHPGHYETGGGYNWQKIPGVQFTPDHVDITHEPNPEDLIGDDLKQPRIPGTFADTGDRVDYVEHTHEDFIRAMRQNPGESVHSLAFADWLDENGQPAYAEIVRGHVARSNAGPHYHTWANALTDAAARESPYAPVAAAWRNFGPHDHLRTVAVHHYYPVDDVPGRTSGGVYHSVTVPPEDAARLLAGLESEGISGVPGARRDIGLPDPSDPTQNARVDYVEHTENEFHAQIHQTPDERTAHLVYADWLEENGKPHAAELIRMAADNHLRTPGQANVMVHDADPDDPHVPASTSVWPSEGYTGHRVFLRMPLQSYTSPTRHVTWWTPPLPSSEVHRLRFGLHQEGFPDEDDARRAAVMGEHDDPFGPAETGGDGVVVDDYAAYDCGPTDYGPAEEEQAFQQAIDDNPLDGTNHLVFADWLQEQGNHDEAAFRRSMGDWVREQHERGESPLDRHVRDDLFLSNPSWSTHESHYPAGVEQRFLSIRFPGEHPNDDPGAGIYVGHGYHRWHNYRDMEQGLREAFMRRREHFRRSAAEHPDWQQPADLRDESAAYATNPDDQLIEETFPWGGPVKINNLPDRPAKPAHPPGFTPWGQQPAPTAPQAPATMPRGWQTPPPPNPQQPLPADSWADYPEVGSEPPPQPDPGPQPPAGATTVGWHGQQPPSMADWTPGHDPSLPTYDPATGGFAPPPPPVGVAAAQAVKSGKPMPTTPTSGPGWELVDDATSHIPWDRAPQQPPSAPQAPAPQGHGYDPEPGQYDADGTLYGEQDELAAFHQGFHQSTSFADHDSWIPDPNTNDHMVFADWLQERGRDATADLIRRSAGGSDATSRTAATPLGTGDRPEEWSHRPWMTAAPGQFAAIRETGGLGRGNHIPAVSLVQRSVVNPDRMFWWVGYYANEQERDAAVRKMTREGVLHLAHHDTDKSYEFDPDGPTQNARVDYGPAEEEQAFRQAIHADPHDYTNHGVFSDWLREQGRHDEADFQQAMGAWMAAPGRMRSGRYQDQIAHEYPWFAKINEDRGFPDGVLWNAMPWFDHGRYEVRNDPRHPDLTVIDPHSPENSHVARWHGWTGAFSWKTYPDMERTMRESFLQTRQAQRQQSAQDAPPPPADVPDESAVAQYPDEQNAAYSHAPTEYVEHAHEDFHRQILENPGEWSNYLVYADWLEENGQTALAHAVRSAASSPVSAAGLRNLQVWSNAETPMASPQHDIVPMGDGKHSVFFRFPLTGGHRDDLHLNGWTPPVPWGEAVRLGRALHGEGIPYDPENGFGPPDEYGTQPEQNCRYDQDGDVGVEEPNLGGGDDSVIYGPHEEDQAFRQAIAAAPADGTNHGVYADYLDERGDAHRAGFHRAMMSHLQQSPADDEFGLDMLQLSENGAVRPVDDGTVAVRVMNLPTTSRRFWDYHLGFAPTQVPRMLGGQWASFDGWGHVVWPDHESMINGLRHAHDWATDNPPDDAHDEPYAAYDCLGDGGYPHDVPHDPADDLALAVRGVCAALCGTDYDLGGETAAVEPGPDRDYWRNKPWGG